MRARGERLLVGREEEVAAIRAFLAGPANKAPALLLRGDAGIGKTTLWSAAIDHAESLGFRPLVARPAEAESGLSFSVLGDLLGDLHDEIGRLREVQRKALRLALLLEEPGSWSPDARALGAAVGALVDGLAEHQPVVIAIDDIQWIDRPSASALSYGLRRVRGRVVVLAARRTPADERLVLHDPFVVDVPPLEPLALGQIVRSQLGVRLSAPLVGRLADLSGGNPFFALELARGIAARPEPMREPDPIPVPEDLRSIVSDRLRALPREARNGSIVAALAARPSRDILERAGVDATSAIDAGILVSNDGAFAFAHPLLRSVIVDESTEEELRTAHSRLAAIVEDPEERARHTAAASSRPDAAVADGLDCAAQLARSRGAPQAAAGLAAQAVALTPPEHESALHVRRLAHARYLELAGDPAGAIALLEQQADETPPGPRRSEVLAALGEMQVETLGSGIQTLQAALEHADDRTRACVLAQLAFTIPFSEGVDKKIAYAREAVRLAESVGDVDLLAQSLAELAHLERGPESERLFERALEVEQQTTAVPFDKRPSVLYALGLLRRRRVGEALERFRNLLDDARKEGFASLSTALFYVAMAETMAGNWSAADQLAVEAEALLDATGETVDLAILLAMRSRLDALCGRFEAARRRARTALEAADAAGLPTWVAQARGVLGLTSFLEGDPRRACDDLLAATNYALAVGAAGPHAETAVEALVAANRIDNARQLGERVRDSGEVPSQFARAEAAIAAAEGDLSAARRLLAGLLADPSTRAVPIDHGRALLALGQVERRARRRAQARAALESAVTIFRELGAEPFATRAEDELSHLGGRAPQHASLTEVESRIASLVSQGRSNQEVAAALFVSPKTVEWNLSKIYKKLHVRGRAELAAKLARQR
jgi:DNA-binding CsgD family transcriptional regulator